MAHCCYSRGVRKTAPCAGQQLMQLWPHLDERARRMVAAAEALRIGWGGVTQVSRVCGLSRVTITNGLAELNEAPLPEGRVRRGGGGGAGRGGAGWAWRRGG